MTSAAPTAISVRTPGSCNRLRAAAVALLGLGLSATSAHAAPPNRLAANAARTALTGLPQGVSPRARNSAQLGRLGGDTFIERASLVLAPSAEQSAALDQLLADQQNPASPSYHQWLTPEQFGERFGASDSDLKTLQSWLTSQGLQIQGVSRSRNSIQFGGRAETVEAAFHTELHRFSQGNREYFENTTVPEMPAGLAGIVQAVRGLSSYRVQANAVHPVVRQQSNPGTQPNSTSSTGSTHYIVPYDFRQIYNANGLFNSGFTGTGVRIGVIGQSAVDTQQLNNFQTLTGQTVKNPTLVLVPNTGTSTRYSPDEGESEADLEQAGGGAPGASLVFIYTGSGNYDVFDALEYAITNKLADILTLSYSSCEAGNSLSSLQSLDVFLRQANAQGQTFMASSGDSGAASCDSATSTTAYDGAQVSYPASSAFTTAVGGTTLVDASGNYWSATNNGMHGSALGYIPETTWNDSSGGTLLSGGGGASRYFSKPNWQNAPGVPADGARDVPDVSFSASTEHDTYLICTSDTSFVSGTRTGACTSTAFGAFSVGGTSLSSPSFAAALAILENANGSVGLGNINPLLYALRSSTPAIFHDVTTGNNQVPCASGTQGCTNGVVGYAAGTGYDLATGLGSVDLGALSTALAAASNAAANTPTVLVTATSAGTTSITLNVRVSSNRLSVVPSGSVAVAVDGGTPQTVVLSNGQASVALAGTYATGSYTVRAAYTGDTTYAAAVGTLTLTVQPPNATVTLSVAPTTLTVQTTGAAKGSWTLTTTSVNGYAGLLSYGVTMADGSAPKFGGCFVGQGDAGISAGATLTTTISYSVLTADCSSSSAVPVLSGAAHQPAGSLPAVVRPTHTTTLPLLAVASTGLLGSAAMRRRRNWMVGLVAVTFLAATGALSGCGDGFHPATTTTTTSTGASTVSVTKGTYNLLITVGAYTSSTATATVPVTLIVQ